MPIDLQDAIQDKTAELKAPQAEKVKFGKPTVPDLVTMASYGLGLWWCLGGPPWAGITSVVLDEVDGRLARAIGQTSERGAMLDWGADIALTPMALMRLGREVHADHGAGVAIMAAPFVLYGQATCKANGYRPMVGSARAAIIISAILIGNMKERWAGFKGPSEEEVRQMHEGEKQEMEMRHEAERERGR